MKYDLSGVTTRHKRESYVVARLIAFFVRGIRPLLIKACTLAGQGVTTSMPATLVSVTGTTRIVTLPSPNNDILLFSLETSGLAHQTMSGTDRSIKAIIDGERRPHVLVDNTRNRSFTTLTGW